MTCTNPDRDKTLCLGWMVLSQNGESRKCTLCGYTILLKKFTREGINQAFSNDINPIGYYNTTGEWVDIKKLSS